MAVRADNTPDTAENVEQTKGGLFSRNPLSDPIKSHYTHNVIFDKSTF